MFDNFSLDLGDFSVKNVASRVVTSTVGMFSVWWLGPYGGHIGNQLNKKILSAMGIPEGEGAWNRVENVGKTYDVFYAITGPLANVVMPGSGAVLQAEKETVEAFFAGTLTLDQFVSTAVQVAGLVGGVEGGVDFLDAASEIAGFDIPDGDRLPTIGTDFLDVSGLGSATPGATEHVLTSTDAIEVGLAIADKNMKAPILMFALAHKAAGGTFGYTPNRTDWLRVVAGYL